MSSREDWLIRAVDALSGLFKQEGHDLPEVRVSVGFPGGGSKRKTIGECWKPSASTDGVSQLFISPILDDPVRVLDVLVHELAHAVVQANYPEARGHGADFGRIARALGLEGKLTATVAGEALHGTLTAIAEALGEFPHAAIKLGEGQKKQTTRMLKCQCDNPGCETFDPEVGTGYSIRTTAKWLDQFGAPICICGVGMERV